MSIRDVFDIVAGLVIAAFFHERIVRRLRAEVAILTKQISTLPGHIIDALLEHGAIQQDREPLARRTVEDFFGIEQPLSRTYPRVFNRRVSRSGPQMSQVLGSADRPPETPTGRKD
jgi:hypothetical protein